MIVILRLTFNEKQGARKYLKLNKHWRAVRMHYPCALGLRIEPILT